ncbi:MAG: hypothetical protein IJF59_05050 [Clostridia bacterium]|nr:hypothetical protein [Clostridia bacterium]MBQ3076490.1 hypothetical protein [Clostridia bacterium]
MGFYRDLAGLAVIFFGAGVLLATFLPPALLVVLLAALIIGVGYLILCSR